MHPTRTLPYIFLLAMALATLVGGCGRQRIRPTVAEPETGWDAPTAVDVENFYGSVTIRVDPQVKSVRPVAVVRTSWSTDLGNRQAAKDSVTVTARTVVEGGRTVLRVRTSSNWKDPTQVWVNLKIVMPRCDGLRVWNRGGKVKLIGVAGAVLVDNGPRFDDRGDIELRTGAPMTEPVALVTGRGSVVYQIGSASSGQFDLTSETGQVEFESPVVKPDAMHTDGKRVTATLNSGANAVLLRSGHGLVRVFVTDDPVAYAN
jgi:hypothetical protein